MQESSSSETDGDKTRKITAANEVEADTEAIGSVIAGRYKLLELVGEGGMGRVYKALQLATGRAVALKMMRANVVDVEGRQRFHQEAKIASTLNHPNTAVIHDFGDTSHGQLYLVMEYVEGIGLDEMIRVSGQLGPTEVVELFVPICELLAEAHAHAIIHRDLKPSNVMLTRTKTGKNVVKVLDFGIAKKHDSEQVQNLTQPGQIVGSPQYMSPEQCAGEQTSAATDIYSIGCMLYEALLGRAPFVAPTIFALVSMHRKDQAKSFKGARPDLTIPAALEQITMRCLRKDPKERFGSAEELLAALKKCAQKGESTAKPRLLTTALISLASVALFTLPFVFFSMSKRTTAPVKQNDASEVVSHPETPEALTIKLQEDARKKQQIRNDNRFAEMREQLNTVKRVTHKDYHDYYSIGVLTLRLGGSVESECIADFTKSIALAEVELKGKNRERAIRNIAWCCQNRGYIYATEGKYEQAIADLTRAIELRPKYKNNYVNRAAAYKRLGKIDLAASDLQLARSLPDLDETGREGFK